MIYPPLCLFCEQKTDATRHLFCSTCLQHLTLLTLDQRCPRCFKNLEESKHCPSCKSHPTHFKCSAATCEKFGPPLSLLRHYEQGNSAVAKTIGSMMALQLIQLDWPLPDWIIPFPTHLFPRLLARGKLTQMVAREISRILEKPVALALKKKITFSYFLDPKQQSHSHLAIANNGSFADQTLLLISLSEEKEALNLAAKLLKESFPQAIYHLSFLETADSSN